MNILIFIIACQFESPSVNSNLADDPTAQGDTQDTAHLPIVEDCEPSNLEFTNLSLLETKVPTVPQVQWEGSAAELHYIDGRGIERIIISQDVGGETQRALPMGLRANQTYNAQLVRKEDGTVVACSEPIALKTNALPAAFPEIDVSVHAKGDDGLIITNILSLDSSFLVAFDGDGEVVWALEEPNQIPEGNHFPVKNILFDSYRQSILFSRWQNTDFCGRDGYLTWVDWAGNTQDRWPVEGLRVGMTQLDNDSLAVLRCDNTGSGFEEDILSVVTADGVEDVWRARDTFPDLTAINPDLSWVHTNYLQRLSQDVVLMSMEQVQTVGAFNVRTNQFVWRLSGKPDEGTYQSAEPLVDRPHSLTPFDDGLLIYNRSSHDNVADGCAHIRYVTFDEQEMTAESPWRLDFDPCSPLGFFGDVFTGDSDIIVIWSDKGQINTYGTDDFRENHMQINLPLGYAFTFGDYLSWEDINVFSPLD
ncbi:MAG: hypothetical protein ACON4U_17500 [Myxococcota bacterium]